MNTQSFTIFICLSLEHLSFYFNLWDKRLNQYNVEILIIKTSVYILTSLVLYITSSLIFEPTISSQDNCEIFSSWVSKLSLAI